MAEGDYDMQQDVVLLDDEEEVDIVRPVTTQEQSLSHASHSRSPVWTYFSVKDLDNKD